MEISLFENMTSKTPSTGTLEGVAELIRRDEKLKAFTLSYRQTGSKAFKNEAPLFAVACRFEGGKGKENATTLTGLSLVDFDHILSRKSEERRVKSEESIGDSSLEALKAKVIADPHTVMCYTTISGNGLRVIFKYDPPHTDESFKSHTDSTDLTDGSRLDNASQNTSSKGTKSVRSVCKKDLSSEGTQSVGQRDMKTVGAYYQQAFHAGNAYYERLLGVKADMQCKNLTRLSGLAHDPGVFIRPVAEAVAFTVEEVSAAAVAHAKQSKEDRQTQRIQTYFDTLIAPQLDKAGIVFRSGSHNDYVMRVGYRLAERRFARTVAVRWAVARFGGDYPDTEQVVNSCFDNASPRGDSGGNRGGGRDGGRFASVDDIKAFLDGHVSLRFNEITSRVEFLSHTDESLMSHTDSTDLTDGSRPDNTYQNGCSEGTQSVRSVRSVCKNINSEGTQSVESVRSVCKRDIDSEGTQSVGKETWHPINDRKVNSLWAEMSQATRVNKQDMYSIIESDYVPVFNPFKDYLFGLPEWHEGDHDYIADLAATVKVKGEPPADKLTDAPLCTFHSSLRKWLVAMVASWISDDVVNNVILVLIGEQGSFKTTWFNYLLPPELKQYFYTKTNANRMTKDDLLTLAQYALVCCEELDSMRPAELNQLKAAVTMPSIDERAAYAHFHEHRKHIASFCGTGNNPQFLSDPTGNRRWLPFEVESIVSPREHPFHYRGVYSQALALYQGGFRFWFTKEEIQELNKHNRQFETPRLEWELVALYFRVPTGAECGIFMTSARAMQIVGAGISQKLNATRLGLAFHELGFKRVRYNGIRGYHVVLRTAEEMQAYQRGIAPNVPYGQNDGDDNALPF